MNLFDCHNHLQDARLFPMISEVMERARNADVTRMGVKGCCEDDWARVIIVMDTYEGIHPAFGLHPWFIGDRSPEWT